MVDQISDYSQSNQNELSQDQLSEEISDLMVKTGVFDDQRFFGQVPNYEMSNFREYLANPQGYRINQAEDVKFNYELRKQMEQRLMMHVNQLSQSEKVNMIGNLVPEFGKALERLRTVSTKYDTLMQRLNPSGLHPTVLNMHGGKLRELLMSDKFAKKIKLVDDFSAGRQAGNLSLNVQKTLQPTDVEEIGGKQGRKEQIFEQNNQLQDTEMKLKDA